LWPAVNGNILKKAGEGESFLGSSPVIVFSSEVALASYASVASRPNVGFIVHSQVKKIYITYWSQLMSSIKVSVAHAY
jgi:hypothetical protein